ncbi:structural protein [Roseovarius Plymouth podovirus 1]|uniref:Structural protein n=2 Tax=Roseovarius Plymouth podovirus 1 TaxID=926474 RepID=K4Q564_9CAUD|nr:structural protein [Roseovarius Plymouth podovirus 1]CBW47057.1 structural protein [Roseovarius sp. 217 phage 1]CBX87993.1 structural protein [Roseovarius Plymouth podovirus 1]
MADPRLQWRQLNQAQPNVAGLMRGSNESLMAAGEAAKGILSSYQEGAETKAHNELLRRTGGKSQDEITAMYQAGAFDDLNLGEKGLTDLRDTMTRRSDLDYTNSNTRNTDARTANTYQNMSQSRDKHGIFMREDGRMVDQREWLQENAGSIVNDRLGGLNNGSSIPRGQGEFVRAGDHVFGNADPGQGPVNGNTGAVQASPETVMRLARTLQAEAGNQGAEGMLAVGSVIRNRAASGKYGEGIDGVIMKPGQFSAWNSQTGYAGGEQGQDMNFQPGEEAMAVAQAILSGQYEDPTQGATHYYNPAISQPAWGGPIVNDRRDNQGNQEPIRGFGGDQTAARMAASGLFVPSEIRAEQSPLEEAATRGDTLNEEQRVETILDQTLLTAESLSQDPNITTKEQFIRQGREEMLQTGLDMSEPEIYALEQRLSEIYDGSPILQENLTPGESTAEQLIRQTQTADQQTDIGLARGAVGGTPEAQLTVDAEGFAGMSTSTEKSAALIDQFRLMDDDFENNPIFGRDADFDPATMDQHLQKAHRELRKSDPDLTIDEVYALASRVFEADPTGRNTLNNQVSIDRMEELLGTYSTDGGRNFAEARNNIDRVDREMTLNASQEAQIQSQLRRSAVQNDPELKRRYETQLQDLREQREGLVKELQQYSSIVEEEDAREAAAALATPGPGASVRRVQ